MRCILKNWIHIEYEVEIIDEIVDEEMEVFENVSEMDDAEIAGAEYDR